jgi:hypothetical protein
MRNQETRERLKEPEPDEQGLDLAPMTGQQAFALKALSEETRNPDVYSPSLTKREATKRIDALKEKLRLGALPPHTD